MMHFGYSRRSMEFDFARPGSITMHFDTSNQSNWVARQPAGQPGRRPARRRRRHCRHRHRHPHRHRHRHCHRRLCDGFMVR